MKAVVVTVLLALLTAPAMARPTEVIWEVSHCDETAAVVRSGAGGNALVVLAYRCDEAVIDGRSIHDFSVSEVSRMENDGTFTLLRQVTNNQVLHGHLRAMGLTDSYIGRIDYGDGAAGSAPSITVRFGSKSYAFSGVGGATGIPPQPTIGGAGYNYDGDKGTIKIQYRNETQSFTPALVTIDATDDPALQRWVGGDSATGPGVVAAGDWIGTATLID